jgi:DNA-binding CsgD family transcriptional regulator
MECLLLASRGQNAHEIGHRLGLSGRTVLYLANSVCSNLKVSNLNQAVAEALRCGFIR